MDKQLPDMSHEYQLLDLVPCCIAIIDKELRIVDSNRMIRDTYGNVEGTCCYKALKGREMPCANCIAKKAFFSKTTQQDKHVWVSPEGERHSYQITAVPLRNDDGKVSTIMEMAVDITEITRLREQENIRNFMLTEIIHHSFRGLVVIADNNDILFLNPALVRILGLPAIGASAEEIYALLPEEVNKAIAGGAESFAFTELLLFPERGEKAIPVNMQGTRLKKGDMSLGLLLGFHDLREIKQLTKAKVDAERMAAVGHTISGLSHGIKNLVTALEGGMYMLTSGMENSKPDRMGKQLCRKHQTGGHLQSWTGHVVRSSGSQRTGQR
ncbi:MAG: PAS domain-containing protein [Desulfovibrio sp.]|jgi:PAS domain-containing protein|nr:PAS domain-containing protein [Desulfovibrio sp.]